MTHIALTQGYSTIIDDADLQAATNFKWFAVRSKRHNLVYAARSYWVKESGSWKMKREYLHHFILGRQDGLKTDHINGNGLDNRRSNLRFCTHAQNMANRKPMPNATGVPNVQKIGERFRVRFSINNKKQCFGCYPTLTEAKLVAEETAARLRGKFLRAA